jgi:ubiquinone/menaquinone biosynthesis C-methylase UbiE
MDYDKTAIATTYDAARGYRPEAMRQWLDRVAAHAPRDLKLIVDLGCGTGRFTHPLAERFNARVIGVDPSTKMLEGARAKLSNGRVTFLQASAEGLPLDDGGVDLGPIDIQDSHRESVLIHWASDQLIRSAKHGETIRAQ